MFLEILASYILKYPKSKNELRLIKTIFEMPPIVMSNLTSTDPRRINKAPKCDIGMTNKMSHAASRRLRL